MQFKSFQFQVGFCDFAFGVGGGVGAVEVGNAFKFIVFDHDIQDGCHRLVNADEFVIVIADVVERLGVSVDNDFMYLIINEISRYQTSFHLVVGVGVDGIFGYDKAVSIQNHRINLIVAHEEIDGVGGELAVFRPEDGHGVHSQRRIRHDISDGIASALQIASEKFSFMVGKEVGDAVGRVHAHKEGVGVKGERI